jgi:hypothetical protein
LAQPSAILSTSRGCLGNVGHAAIKLNVEGWLVNRQEGMLIQIKPDAATE